MDFIIENYVWFTIIGVFLVMALIGFIAEKTDFGRKGREVKPKIEKEVLKEVKPVIEEPVVVKQEEFKPLMPSFDELLETPVLETKIEEVIEPVVADIPVVEEIIEPIINEEPVIEEIVEEPIIDIEEIKPTEISNAPIEEILPDINNIKDEAAVEEENIWKI